MKKYWIGCFLGLCIGAHASHVMIEGDVFYVGRSKASKNIIMEQEHLCDCQQTTACDVASKMGHDVAFIGKFAITPSPREALQFRLTDWVNFKSILYSDNADPITFPFDDNIDTYDWVNAQSGKAYYNSNFVAYDITYMYYFSPRWFNYFFFGIGGGIGYAKINEQFKVRYFNDYRTSKYDIKTENALYGGQFLIDVGSSPSSYLAWGVALRVGMNADMIQVRQYLDDNDGTVLIMNSAQNSLKPSYYGEINPYILWRPFTTVSVNVGYMLMYYADIAEAPSQINYDPSTSQGIKHHDDMNFQGFYAGLSFYF